MSEAIAPEMLRASMAAFAPLDSSTITPGIHRIPMAQYIADPCPEPSLSSSCAFTLIASSPMHAYHRHPRLGGKSRGDSTTADRGSLTHDLLLGGEGKICVIDPQEHRSKPTKEEPRGSVPIGWTNGAMRDARDSARAKGLIPVLPWDVAGARESVKAAREFIATTEFAHLFERGEGELTVIAKQAGCWLRIRPDWLNTDDEVSLSYKTTAASVEPRAFEKIIRGSGYDFSCAFYAHVLGLVLGHQRTRHIILAQEQAAPYACSLFEMTPVKADIEQARVELAIEQWVKCRKTNRWPGYSPAVNPLDAKPWELEVEVAYA